jgi:hypothetical protein
VKVEAGLAKVKFKRLKIPHQLFSLHTHTKSLPMKSLIPQRLCRKTVNDSVVTICRYNCFQINLVPRGNQLPSPAGLHSFSGIVRLLPNSHCTTWHGADDSTTNSAIRGLIYVPSIAIWRSGSVVSLATAYGLDGPGIESRWGRDFPHLFRPALRPTQPPVKWVPGLSRGKVRPGRDADPSPPSSDEVKNRVELYLYSP